MKYYQKVFKKWRSIDNIAIERFWRSLKYEDVYLKNYNTITEARAGIGEYIEIYNKERLHSAIGNHTPDEVYYEGRDEAKYDPKEFFLKAA